MQSKYVQFAIRAATVGVVALLGYVGANASDVADPATAGLVSAAVAAIVNFIHARSGAESV